ncbi:Lovastatin diketide synthase LovF [Neonectria ditissima]|uniref:Lovastatin diketide synthase LovF n=1 Tax=Neonectria ditissima TaxID=78410 RepID=A0A0P7AEP7_9HYPO|nr:Lovastatin diketide synthase LovF [Neonectria ditissima]
MTNAENINALNGTNGINGTNGHYTNGANGTHTNGSNGTNGTHANDTHTNGINGSNGTNGHHHNGSNGTFTNGSNGTTTNGTHVNGSPNGNTPQAAAPIPIAICGMACRLPGGLHTPQQLWEFLVAKGDARTRVPESRYNVDAYYSPHVKPGSVKSEYGYFLDESVNLGSIDGSFFNLGRTEAERADPHQRQMLEVVRECVDDAGETDFKGGLIGCYMGSFGEDWIEMWAKEPQQWGMHRVGGYGDFLLSNRISYEMDLHGPSMTIRTGCSAALVCLNEACVAIQRGDCTSAIVGGANLIMAPNMTTAMTEQGVLSPDGSCKSFSADADGYGRGEAITAIYVKPLSAALRDNNPIRAVIRATATNHDGKTPGLTYPNTESHESMMRKAYRDAGLDFAETAFVECHGTGTPVGDPIEANAVARVFGDKGVYIGSVKPNLGHSEGASGLTSLLKVVMALQHRTIPPNIKFTTPNPNIPFEARKLTVPLEPTPWPEDRYERASVNSFGIGGANAHVIIDSARSFNIEPKPKPDLRTPQLLVYSANSASSLKNMAEGYQEFLGSHPESLGDLAYTLANRRQHLTHRAFMVATRERAGLVSPTSKIGQASGVVMVFTGQGAQWPQMARELLQSNDIFKRTIRSLDKHLQSIKNGPEWSLEEELLKPPRSSRVESAQLSQPACTAIQLAMIDCLTAIGIKPTAVVGHSSGEIAAAYAAGALTAHEAITAAWLRGEVTLQQKRKGAMAAIGLGWEDVEPCLVPGVVRACENSPKSITLSGDADKLQAVVAVIHKAHPDVLARMLKVDKAYHSYHMAEIGGEYRSLMKTHGVVGGAARKCNFFSSVTGKLLDTKQALGPAYWQTNLESPVMFSTAVTSILNDPVGKNICFLEIGPHSALSGPLRQIAAEQSMTVPYAAAMIRKQNCIESMLTAVGKLFSQNVPIDFSALMPEGTCLPDLPRYPWNHEESYWHESRISKEWRHRGHAYHDLLGFRVAESTDMEPTWRNLLHLENVPWVRDHIIGDNAVFPFAGYVAMIGEAVRQTTGVQDAFSLRHILVNSALLLTEGNPVEVMTSFRPYRLTDSLDSSWWEFTVASHDGNAWTKHCTGQVKALSTSPEEAESKDALPRSLGTRKCYDTMSRAGLNYGRQFQRLEDITAGTVEQVAAAKVSNNKVGDEESYHLHPVIIDACLQLLSVAATKGFTTKPVMSVPTVIEKLIIYRTAGDVNLDVSATMSKFGAIAGEGRGVANGHTVLQMAGVRLAALDDGGSAEGRTDQATTRYEWGPHLDFMDPTTLIKPDPERVPYASVLEELTRLCLVFSGRRLAGAETTLSHMQKYRDWIQGQLQSTDVSAFENTSEDALLDRINTLTLELAETPAADVAAVMHKICSDITGIFNGQLDAMEVVLANDTLTKVFSFRDSFNRSPFLRHLAHSKPSLKVLEVGAGTGAPPVGAWTDLAFPDGRIFYSEYTITELSSSLLLANKERTKGLANVHHSVLNLSQDPLEQGFEEGQYDLVIATNAVHSTKSLAETLKHIRKLLRPDGRLLLQELCPSSKWPNYIFGILPWWWCGAADERTEEPYVTPQRWNAELLAAGFDEPAIVPGSGEPMEENSIIIAKPLEPELASEKVVTVLCAPGDSTANALSKVLETRGFVVHSCSPDAVPAPGQDVIALLEKDDPFFENITATQFDNFKKLVGGLSDAGLFWVTRQSQMQCVSPAYAQVVGAARTIRSEMAVEFATCEVDDVDASLGQIADVFTRFRARENERSEWLHPDYEYAIQDGVVHIGRYYPFSLSQELLTANPSEPIVLDTKKPGLLTALTWSRREARALVGDDVEVNVHAGGLNFRDVLSANGIIEIPEEGFGLEATGVVARLGPDVTDLQVGDRVILFSRGSFSSSIITSAKLCEVIPDNLSFEDGATMACVYATAIYSLIDIGALKPGQSVLIHSACGGVGIAAIQIARMLGAEIYVTVGSEVKVKYLMDTFGLPRNRIFNSRNDSFVDGVARETGGVGVDLVLNSLSGELLHATWRCVAEFGKMVEIGKRDLLGSGKLDMDVFMANRSYCCVDMDQMCSKRPAVCKGLLGAVVRYFNDGHILPISPNKVFSADSVQEAFRYMQRGLHIGKIVISIRETTGELKIDADSATRPKVVKLDASASYLLIGGLGGLGRAVSRWMVEHGARNLVYLSRGGGSRPGEQAIVRELESMGCGVKLVKGSVSVLNDVARALEAAPKLKGILQMSMILRDNAVPRMSHEDWTTAVEPKITGTWNLHHATVAAGCDLDFMLLFSSISGIIGQPGQANYSSASAFLDTFVQYRTELGLPASTIDIGDVTDIGVISDDDGLRRVMKLTGAYGINEQELLDAIAMSMSFTSASSPPSMRGPASTFVTQNNFVVGLASATALESADNRSIWRKDKRMAVYHNTSLGASTRSGTSSDSLNAFLGSVRRDASRLKEAATANTLAREIGRKLLSLIMRPEEDLVTSTPLSNLGMDSLVAIEMRTWWRQTFGFDISVLEIMGMASLDALGIHAAQGMLKALEGDGQ